MIARPSETWQTTPAGDPGLNSLECLGAFFTSQIHDLNNQVAVLSNSELLLPNETISLEMAEFVGSLFGAIHRLSHTCSQFNTVRKIYPVPVEKITVQEAIDCIAGAVGDHRGWQAHSKITKNAEILLNPEWMPMIVSQVIDAMHATGGGVEISIAELPPRQYKYSLRSSFTQGPTKAFLVHFKGDPSANAFPEEHAVESENFRIAIELVRLLGAGISLSRSDSKKDCLIACRLA